MRFLNAASTILLTTEHHIHARKLPEEWINSLEGRTTKQTFSIMVFTTYQFMPIMHMDEFTVIG